MKPFAELLRIPAEPPEVSVAIRSAAKEDGLVREDLSWESLDGQEVPAFVIGPQNRSGRSPAIICLHGSGGSREEVCAPTFGIAEWTRPDGRVSQNTLLGWGTELARRGYLTLALTQRGLDVRTPATNEQAKDLLVRGRTLMGAIVYEIRQAITFLRQRPEVDPDRIGLTGISFGGITSFYTWLVDDRVAAAAPICGGVGSVDVLLREGSPGYHGFYWWIPDMLTEGDQGEYAASRAPRPLMIWTPLSDIGMPAAGVERFKQVTQPAYRDAPHALEIHQPPGEHSFTLEAFETLTRFFDRILANL